jgi:hypothetical protein
MHFLLQPPPVSTPFLAFVARLFLRLAVAVWVIGAVVALGVLSVAA